ncbi:MAG: hypothetical protein HQM09_19335 [Candidatus Riflebacteria bacterium]|nr:hypothetical protein [Candidatus Riflebacteria bacterium]
MKPHHRITAVVALAQSIAASKQGDAKALHLRISFAKSQAALNQYPKDHLEHILRISDFAGSLCAIVPWKALGVAIDTNSIMKLKITMHSGDDDSMKINQHGISANTFFTGPDEDQCGLHIVTTASGEQNFNVENIDPQIICNLVAEAKYLFNYHHPDNCDLKNHSVTFHFSGLIPLENDSLQPVYPHSIDALYIVPGSHHQTKLIEVGSANR